MNRPIGRIFPIFPIFPVGTGDPPHTAWKKLKPEIPETILSQDYLNIQMD
jgi:hypothetical protein